MRRFAATGLAVCSMLAAGCGSEDATVTPSNVNGEWPLTVREGEVRCEGSSTLIFTTTDGEEYGINGTALTEGYPRIEPIWKRDPDGAFPDARIPIDSLMDRAREKCP